MAVARSQFSDESRLLPFRLESGEDAANDVVLMADAPYLVALALVEQEGRRALPLTGRSLPVEAVATEPTTIAHALALELLLRLWQRSDEGALQRACGVESLLLVELPMDALPEALPTLKAAWLNSGDVEAFQHGLRAICGRAWTMRIAKFEPVTLTPWPA